MWECSMSFTAVTKVVFFFSAETKGRNAFLFPDSSFAYFF